MGYRVENVPPYDVVIHYPHLDQPEIMHANLKPMGNGQEELYRLFAKRHISRIDLRGSDISCKLRMFERRRVFSLDDKWTLWKGPINHEDYRAIKGSLLLY